MMRLITLGTGTVAFSSSRVCAGHYIEAGDVRILLDCGSGVTHRLAQHVPEWRTITHVAFTHFHLDHIADFPTLVYGWKYGSLPGRSLPLHVIGPMGIADLLASMATTFGDWLRDPGFPIVVTEIAPDELLELGDVRLIATKVPHTPESVAYSVERNGRRIVFTGDTGLDLNVAERLRGADLLLSECSLPAAMGIPEHLTPEQCASFAAAAVPVHYVLTHFYPPVESVDIAGIIATQFAGRVTLARDGELFVIEED